MECKSEQFRRSWHISADEVMVNECQFATPKRGAELVTAEYNMLVGKDFGAHFYDPKDECHGSGKSTNS